MNSEEGPLFSILIPVYNGEDFIESVMDSVLGQTYRHIEVIVRDDGSTDRTFSILKNKFSRFIRLYKGENIRQAAGRNFLFSVCNGELVHFHDADDYLLPEYCELVAAEFLKNPNLDLVINNIRFFENGPESKTNHSFSLIASDPILYTLDTVLHPASVSYRKNFLISHLPIFDTRFRPSEDWELGLRLMMSGCNFSVLPDVLVSCPRREDSESRNAMRCAIAIAHIYVNFLNSAANFGIDSNRYSMKIADKLYNFGDRFLTGGFPANAREAWIVAQALDPIYRFNNRVLDFFSQLMGVEVGFLLLGVRRQPFTGLLAGLKYIFSSKQSPIWFS